MSVIVLDVKDTERNRMVLRAFGKYKQIIRINYDKCIIMNKVQRDLVHKWD